MSAARRKFFTAFSMLYLFRFFFFFADPFTRLPASNDPLCRGGHSSGPVGHPECPGGPEAALAFERVRACARR